MTSHRVSTSHRYALRAVVATVVLSACNGSTSYLDATGAGGREEAILGRWLTVVACAVVLFVCIAIVAGILRHRGDAAAADTDHPHRRDVPSGLRWIWIGLGVTVVVLLAAYAGTIRTLSAAARPPRTPALTLDITAHQWWWEVRYDKAGEPGFGFVTANDVHLPVGEPVRVRLHSADVIHSFWIPQLAGKTDVIPGQVNETWLEAREPGTSRGMCAEYCGLQHAVMALAVTAEPPAAFAHWAEAQRREAAPPATDEVRVGRVVFQRSCGACHAVQGTMALGRMGPDLTHLASRPTIGAGALANTPANLARWIPNAPAIKEGARMPAVPLDAAELRAVVAWLETLR